MTDSNSRRRTDGLAAFFPRRRSILLGLAAAVVMTFGAADSRAQNFRANRMGGGSEPVSKEDLAMYTRLLGLNEAQKQAAQSLHEAYLADQSKASKDLRDQQRKIREEWDDSRDPSIWSTKMPEIMVKYRERTVELDRTLVSDLKAILDSKQTEKWPTFERTFRRRQAVPNGMLAGESVDLVALTDQLNLAKPAPEALSDTLERYSGELDSALQERIKIREELAKDLPGGAGGRSSSSGPPDFTAMQKTMNEMRKAGMKVRDINDKYAGMVRSTLPTEKQADFDTAFKKARFPQIYAEPHTLVSIDAAAKFTDLDAAQNSKVQEVRTSYLRELEGANERLAQATTRAEAEGGGDEMFAGMARWMGQGGGDQGQESDLTKARRARRDLDRQTLDKLKDALNEAQINRLPERDDGNNVRVFGGSGGNRNR